MKVLLIISFFAVINYDLKITARLEKLIQRLKYMPIPTTTISPITHLFDPKFNTNISETHPAVLENLRDHHLYPPSSEPYAFTHGYRLRQLIAPTQQGIPIFASVNNKRNGFFIEKPGFLMSVLVERLKRYEHFVSRRKWKFINFLIQMNFQTEFLKSNKKDADWRVGNGKISPGKYQKTPQFKREDYDLSEIVECFPLHSVLSAMNVTTVDFFSLDVEDHEYKILMTIPFDLLNIKVLAIEHWLAPEGKEAIRKLMLSKG